MTQTPKKPQENPTNGNKENTKSESKSGINTKKAAALPGDYEKNTTNSNKNNNYNNNNNN